MGNSEKIVKQHNSFTMARYDMSVMEKNIIYVLLTKLSDEDDDECLYTIHVKELEEAMGVELNYSQVKKSTNKLLKRSISFVDETIDNVEVLHVSLVSSAKYPSGKGTVVLRVSQDVRPYLFKLDTNFTLFPLLTAAKFKSKYSQRIYEMLAKFKDKGILYMPLEKLRDRLDLIDLDAKKNKYSNFNDFEKRVLLIAVKEINELTNIGLKYATKNDHGSKKITSVTFTFDFKNYKNKLTSSSTLVDNISAVTTIVNKKEEGYTKLPIEQAKAYLQLYNTPKNGGLGWVRDKKLAFYLVKNIPTNILFQHIGKVEMDIKSGKLAYSIPDYFKSLASRISSNTDKIYIEKKAIEIIKDKSETIDPDWSFCFDRMRKIGMEYFAIQRILTSISSGELRIALEELDSELKEKEGKNVVAYFMEKIHKFLERSIDNNENKKTDFLGITLEEKTKE